MDKAEFIKGKCMQMCPEEEIKMREREKLLHPLEIIPGTERNPKADRNRMIKCFSRSAAGKKLLHPKLVRPSKVLNETLNYLLFDVISVEYLPWHVIYDFIADRLRAIRQDMVIQNLSPAESFPLLEPMVRFYAYSAYRLCEDRKHFDSVLNGTQMQECIKRLLCCYSELENSEFVNDFIQSRPSLEALYVLYNLGDEEALWRVLQVPSKWRTKLLVQTAFKLSIAYKLGNFVLTCKLMKQLPPLLALTVSLKLPEIRRKAFRTMSIAYNNKTLGFAIENLKELLLYGSKEDLQKDCSHYQLTFSNDFVYFTKDNLLNNGTVPMRHESFVEEKISEKPLKSLILDE